MKQKLRFGLISVMLVALFVFATTASAQAPTGGTSAPQAVNISNPSASVKVSTIYYATDGTKYTLQDQTLAAQGDSYNYFGEPKTATSFSGSAILSADGPIAASVNTEYPGNKAAGYNGSSAGATTIVLPVVQKNFFGSTTLIAIQNTDTSNDQTIQVAYAGTTSKTVTYTAKAGSSVMVDLATDTQTAFADNWLGSAVITPQNGTTPLVATVFAYSSGRVFGYEGFTQFGKEYYLPLIRSGFAGRTTGIGIADADTAAATDSIVSVEFTGFVDKNANFTQDAGEEYTCTIQGTVPNGQSLILVQNTNFTQGFVGSSQVATTVTGGTCQTSGHANFAAAGGPFLGSAKVTSTGTNIAVQVNDEKSDGSSSGSYNGYLASQASQKIISPIARNDFANKTTGIQVQLITGSSATCTGTYKTASFSTNQTTPPAHNINLTTASPSGTFFLNSQWTTGLDATHGNKNWVGSLTIDCPGGTVVGEINDQETDGKAAVDAAVYNTFSIN